MKTLNNILFTVLCGLSFGAFGHYAFSLGQWNAAVPWLLVFILVFICMYAQHRTRMVAMERDHYKKMVDMYAEKVTITHEEWSDLMMKVKERRDELLAKKRTELAREFARKAYPEAAAALDQGHTDLSYLFPKFTEEELDQVWRLYTGHPKPTTDHGSESESPRESSSAGEQA